MALDRDTTFTWNGHSCFEIRSPVQGSRPGPVPGEPEQPEDRRPGRGVRRDARDPRPLRPHGRCRGDRRPAPAGVAVHPRDEPVARSPAARRDGCRDRMNKGGTVEVAGIKVTMVHADHSAGDWNPGGETTRCTWATRSGSSSNSRTGSGSTPPATPTCTATCATSASCTRRSWRCCRSAGTTRWGRAGPRSRPSCSACSTSSRSTTGRSRS